MHREFMCRSEDANRNLLQAESRISSQSQVGADVEEVR